MTIYVTSQMLLNFLEKSLLCWIKLGFITLGRIGLPCFISLPVPSILVIDTLFSSISYICPPDYSYLRLFYSFNDHQVTTNYCCVLGATGTWTNIGWSLKFWRCFILLSTSTSTLGFVWRHSGTEEWGSELAYESLFMRIGWGK
jgi:hypothetical protein